MRQVILCRASLHGLRSAVLVGALLLLSPVLLPGCGGEGANQVLDAEAEAESIPEGAEACGEGWCPPREVCSLVDFRLQCTCGRELSCGAENQCWEYANGQLSCTQPKATGKINCAEEVGCGAGDICIGPWGNYNSICLRLCKTRDSFCSDGAYCVPLSDPRWVEPFDGICNAGGFVQAGGPCETYGDCSPETICISEESGDAYCRTSCDPNNDRCPVGSTCYSLVGNDEAGICYP